MLQPEVSVEAKTSPLKRRLSAATNTVAQHAAKHMGLGIVCAVAYFDPGNWGVDLQAGSQYGYKLLFVVLVAGLIAVFWQIQANKLGCVTGMDLASHCRLLLHNRPKRTRLYRWCLLYPLYALSEVAIISTDLAELLGSAIAIVLLFPSIPLWTAVLLTATDVIFLLLLSDPLRSKPVKSFEILIGLLVCGILICIAIVIGRTNVDWAKAFDGFLPSKTLFKSGGLYTSVGVLGATVMPHSLFLGSALATQDRACISPPAELAIEDLPIHRAVPRTRTLKTLADTCSSAFHMGAIDSSDKPKCHAEHKNNSYEFVRAHLYHGIVNVVISLVGLAVCINSLILVLSSAVFFYGGMSRSADAASLFDAHSVIRDVIGKPAATLFAIALLCAGQSASIVATLGGQVVSEGFIHWKISPVLRRLITRLLGLIPSMIVALAVGRGGINTLLVISQVTLSMVLPFITFPLVWLTSSKEVMQVRGEPLGLIVDPPSMDSASLSARSAASLGAVQHPENMSVDGSEETERWVDFSSGKVITCLGYAIWFVIVIANVYVIVALALGQGT
ncbi:natural resistance-associated macrophage protein [Punctularia strigosozonata HHB-11173 SS5]|uniref:natural resistance-associated macrophage protein n=1 Tax=Punctularia strigosozonata (strain HHB-11173) TaxID=741275 RepID=UPI0004417F92|nr:natural resistance-associated macrophage protein [Punctularia strigosozonata HHB-11173 SS5]EIN14329.1 natural resistance-associated macrophage protein [Punctularia strigosozonata HHB-11173 SS5]